MFGERTHHEASHRVQGGVEDEGGRVGGARRGDLDELLDGQRLGLQSGVRGNRTATVSQGKAKRDKATS